VTSAKRATGTSPAFQFYPRDWMGGAPGKMTPEETHVYVWLLCLDWEHNGFEYDEKELAHWCRLTRPRFRKAWAKVGPNFVDRDGRLYNPRLDRERAKQQVWREKSSEGGRRGAEKRWPHRQQGGKQGGNDTNNRVVTPPLTGWSSNPVYQNNTLQTSVSKVRSTSNPPKTSAAAGTLAGARERDEAELEDLNRRRIARGEEPIDGL
jgi:uncharacterized protein YdaU (DUF1376 family)